MEMSEEVTGTVSAESAPASTEAAASAPATTDSVAAAGGAVTSGTQAAAGTPSQAPVYSPNYKFTHLGKEHEIDEWARTLIKDAETEKKFKEMYQKAFGMDHYKSGLERERGEHAKAREVVEKYNSLDKELKMLGGQLGKKDFDSFFKNINVSEQDIFEWVQRKLQERALPPEQQAALRAQAMERDRLYYLEQQTQEMQAAMERQQVQARTYELDFTLAKPDVQSFASKYDTLVGQPGAFKQAVIEHGAFVHKMQGLDLSAEQAIEATMQKFGKFLGAVPQAQAQGQSPQAKEPPPVIQHVASKGVSPVKQRPKNLDELKKLADSFQ